MKTPSRTYIESLEQRIAPAAVTINAMQHTASWTDFDGDLVTLKYSTNQEPDFATTDNGAGLLVDKITLAAAAHTNGDFSIKVKPMPGGDGRVNIGRLDAGQVQIHSWVSPMASFSEFDSGKNDTAAQKIIVGTLGAIPYTKFNNTGGDGKSIMFGAVKNFTIRGDIAATSVLVGVAPQPTHITVTGNINGAATVGVPLTGSLGFYGGSNGSVTIMGDIIGGSTQAAGHLLIVGTPANVTVMGSVLGGTGNASGSIATDKSFGTLTIGGNVVGGSGDDSGYVFLSKGIDTLKIGGSVVGGSAPGAGFIQSFSGFARRVTLGGSLLGGSVEQTGALDLNDAGVVKIKGSIVGGSGTHAAADLITGGIAVTHELQSLSIGGDLVGGTYDTGLKLSYNGAVVVNENLGNVAIKGGILGHESFPALLLAGGLAPATPGDYNAIGRVTVGGDVSFGYIAAGQSFHADFLDRVGAAENPDAGIGRVTVGGEWFHSNLSAGINDLTTNGLTTADTRAMGDANLHARIGPVVIKGAILDSPLVADFGGMIAEKIASITAAGVKLFKSGDPGRSLDSFGFVDIAEI